MQGSRRAIVLIVEDNALFRCFLRAGLQHRFPYLEIAEAGDLAEGWRRASEARPDAVFLDIGLPDGNGLDLATRIRDELPGSRVFVCTSHDLPEYRDAAFQRGATAFLLKNDFDWDRTIELVRQAVAEKTTAEEDEFSRLHPALAETESP